MRILSLAFAGDPYRRLAQAKAYATLVHITFCDTGHFVDAGDPFDDSAVAALTECHPQFGAADAETELKRQFAGGIIPFSEQFMTMWPYLLKLKQEGKAQFWENHGVPFRWYAQIEARTK